MAIHGSRAMYSRTMKLQAEKDRAPQPRKLSIPWDISEWMDKPRLLAGVAEDIDGLDWSNPELVAFLRANPGFQLRALLVMVTYAYAMGICESEEVVEVYYRDEALKRMFPTPPPSPTAITRFRRENRGLLKWSVTQVLKRAVRSRFALGTIPLPAGLKKALIDSAGMRIDVGRHLDRSVQVE
jgi:hypothetical protein